MQNLQIDAQRLWDTLMETAKFGATAKGGICRLTLTDLDRQVRDWFKARCEALGCTVTVDEVGNMFARRPGKNDDLPPIAMGSHLDTQPTGGKFDGVLGVLGALEALRTLHETGYETNAPVEIVNWTNEEGSRYAPAMLASGVFAGVFTPDFAYSRADRDGKTFGEELTRIGYKGEEKAGARKFGAMFELHIEQGPILEDEGKNDRHRPRRAGHALVRGHRHRPGGPYRRDADAAAQECAPRRRAHDRAHRRDRAGARAGCGRCGRPDRKQAEQPQRHSRRGVFHRRFPSPGRKSSRRHGGEIARCAHRDSRADEAHLQRGADLGFAGGQIRTGADRLRAHRHQKAGFKSRDMISGAGHDAAYIARVAPTTMIFVPCAGGISHNEAEFYELRRMRRGRAGPAQRGAGI